MESNVIPAPRMSSTEALSVYLPGQGATTFPSRFPSVRARIGSPRSFRAGSDPRLPSFVAQILDSEGDLIEAWPFPLVVDGNDVLPVIGLYLRHAFYLCEILLDHLFALTARHVRHGQLCLLLKHKLLLFKYVKKHDNIGNILTTGTCNAGYDPLFAEPTTA